MAPDLSARARIDGPANLINIVRRPDAAALLRGEGAGYVVDASQPDWQKQVAAIAAGEPITGALDPVGGTTSQALSNLLSPNGVQTVYGGLDDSGASAIDVGSLIFRNISVRGFWLTRWFVGASGEARQRVIGKTIDDFNLRPHENRG